MFASSSSSFFFMCYKFIRIANIGVFLAIAYVFYSFLFYIFVVAVAAFCYVIVPYSEPFERAHWNDER